jgi:hypothetical protein
MNAVSSIFVTVSGIVIEVIPVYLKDVPKPVTGTPLNELGIETAPHTPSYAVIVAAPPLIV